MAWGAGEGEEEQARVVLVAVPYALKAADADTVGAKQCQHSCCRKIW